MVIVILFQVVGTISVALNVETRNMTRKALHTRKKMTRNMSFLFSLLKSSTVCTGLSKILLEIAF